ncbi:hypothetical protein AA0Y32_03615 [Georgenia phoenicis]|uniref:hypothetical protein n=1 Tax=unclassified Georgenia TaxID=2626815 RepID=UPI0039AF1AD2
MTLTYITQSGPYAEFLKLYEPELARSWVNPSGQTLLHLALSHGKPEQRVAISNRLLDDGADPSTLALDEGLTTLHALFGHNDHDFDAEALVLERLLEGGADINAVAGDRWGTPIQTLAAKGKFSDAQLAPFYDVIFARPDLDLLKPGKKGRADLDSARLFGPRRADLLVRMEAYLRDQGREIPAPEREK